jgi:hypothetical protein
MTYHDIWHEPGLFQFQRHPCHGLCIDGAGLYPSQVIMSP